MPADGSAFRDMEEKWSHFKEEPRNLRISSIKEKVSHVGVFHVIGY